MSSSKPRARRADDVPDVEVSPTKLRRVAKEASAKAQPVDEKADRKKSDSECNLEITDSPKEKSISPEMTQEETAKCLSKLTLVQDVKGRSGCGVEKVDPREGKSVPTKGTEEAETEKQVETDYAKSESESSVEKVKGKRLKSHQVGKGVPTEGTEEAETGKEVETRYAKSKSESKLGKIDTEKEKTLAEDSKEIKTEKPVETKSEPKSSSEVEADNEKAESDEPREVAAKKAEQPKDANPQQKERPECSDKNPILSNLLKKGRLDVEADKPKAESDEPREVAAAKKAEQPKEANPQQKERPLYSEENHPIISGLLKDTPEKK